MSEIDGLEYYASPEYADAVDAAVKEASHDGNPKDPFPNLGKEGWDARFVIALIKRGLCLSKATRYAGKPSAPLQAPDPYQEGVIYSSGMYIVRTSEVIRHANP